MMDTCERCGGSAERITTGPFAGSYHGLDYCVVCSKNLCPACMAKGCCGNTPAQSGNEADYDADYGDD